MDLIAYAITMGQQFSYIYRFNSQRWEEFEKDIIGKHLFLFGVGPGVNYYFNKYPDASIDGVIDNDKKKQGFKLKQFMKENKNNIYEEQYISDISVLDKFRPEDIVILITSLKGYEQIYKQLEEYGIIQKYVLLIMEAKQYEDHAVIAEEDIKRVLQEYCCLQINNKKIVFYDQGSYCGHGKYITEQLLKTRNDLDIVWLVNNLSLQVPRGVRLAYSLDKETYIYEMQTAKIWVFDYLIPSYIEKRPEQIYIQVKHWASVTLKSFGLDSALFQREKKHIFDTIRNSTMIDYIIIGSKFDEISSRRGFLFKGEVYYAGSPRTDILFQPLEVKKKVKQFYYLDDEVHLLLYTPTFRIVNNAKVVGNIDLDYEIVKNSLERRFGGIWYILLRLHPQVAAKSYRIKRPEYVIDVSHYYDSQELVAASDILITDYSSIMFEAAFVKKPVFLFAPDRKEYINRERPLLIDYNTLPFPIIESNEKMMQCMEKFNQEEYEKNVTSFLDKYNISEDGHASKRAADFINSLLTN